MLIDTARPEYLPAVGNGLPPASHRECLPAEETANPFVFDRCAGCSALGRLPKIP